VQIAVYYAVIIFFGVPCLVGSVEQSGKGWINGLSIPSTRPLGSVSRTFRFRSPPSRFSDLIFVVLGSYEFCFLCRLFAGSNAYGGTDQQANTFLETMHTTSKWGQLYYDSFKNGRERSTYAVVRPDHQSLMALPIPEKKRSLTFVKLQLSGRGELPSSRRLPVDSLQAALGSFRDHPWSLTLAFARRFLTFNSPKRKKRSLTFVKLQLSGRGELNPRPLGPELNTFNLL
jgi:hypothetical protein